MELQIDAIVQVLMQWADRSGLELGFDEAAENDVIGVEVSFGTNPVWLATFCWNTKLGCWFCHFTDDDYVVHAEVISKLGLVATILLGMTPADG